MSNRGLLRLAIVCMVVTLAGAAQLWSARAIALPELGTIPAFALTDEHGAELSRAALLGKITVVDFVFTSCSSACPLLSAELARLQVDVKRRGLAERVRLLSISVDPERDTTPRLLELATRYGADPAMWHFVRGDEQSLRRVVVDGMKQIMDRAADPSEKDGFTLLHGTRFVLVDEHARIRGFYDANDAPEMLRLREELTALANGRVRVAERMPDPTP